MLKFWIVCCILNLILIKCSEDQINEALLYTDALKDYEILKDKHPHLYTFAIYVGIFIAIISGPILLTRILIK